MQNQQSRQSRLDVSVIVPVYNRADVIRRAVDSLLNQDFQRPYEIVVVDDGSTDGSAERIAAIDPRVRIICQTNRGAAAARCRGIEAAGAEIVAFLDSDDVAEPCHLSSLWEGLHRARGAALAFARVADMNGRPFDCERLPAVDSASGLIADPLLALMTIGCFTASMNLMTYRDVALAAARGRERFRAANDYDFAFRCAAAGKFAFVDRITMRCDRRADGISRRAGALQAGYAVLAARDAARQSGRRDAALKTALAGRLQSLWPSAFVQCFRTRELALALEVAWAGMRCAPLGKSARYLWWALNSASA